MPVIPYKKTVDIDTYGVFAGLGEVPPAAGVRKMLADPDTGQFSQSKFDAFVKVLADTQKQAYTDYGRIFSAAEKAYNGWFTASTVKEQARRLLEEGLPATARFLGYADAALTRLVSDPSDSAWDTPVLYTRTMNRYITEMGNLRSDAQAMEAALDLSLYNALLYRAAELLKPFAKLGEEILKVPGAVGDTLEKGNWLTKNWHWLLLGGVGVFYVLPAMLRTGRAYKSGGFEAGSQAFEESLRSGRETIASGARSAASGAVSVGKKAAALYTGNPALAVSGMKRRRTRRRR